jgi:Plavaka transposase
MVYAGLWNLITNSYYFPLIYF